MTNYRKNMKTNKKLQAKRTVKRIINKAAGSDVKFINWKFHWGYIENKYGKMLIYEPIKFFDGYSRLTYQSNIAKKIQSNQYQLFVDVGAAWGYFPRIAATHCKKVIAYEANPIRFGVLLSNTKELLNVDCRYKYVSNRGYIPRMGDVIEMVKIDAKNKYNIPVAALDDELSFLLPISLNEEEITSELKTLIKIDVEGGELHVLDGAKKLLKMPNIHWSIDIHPKKGVKPAEVFNYFEGRKRQNHANINCFFGDFIG